MTIVFNTNKMSERKDFTSTSKCRQVANLNAYTILHLSVSGLGQGS